MRAGFLSGRTRPSEYRIQQLKHLKKLITENQDELCQALWHDLHKVWLKVYSFAAVYKPIKVLSQYK